MAKINAGILGGVSGKVGNVVGGSWKGIDWLRIWKKPAMSMEAQSVAARSAMGFLIPFGKYNNETLLKTTFGYVSKGKQFSPFNRFISVNNKDRDPAADFAGTRWSEGVIQKPTISAAQYSVSTNTVTCTLDPGDGGYGSDEDKMILFVSAQDDPAIEWIEPLETAGNVAYAVNKCGTGMYKILSSSKTPSTGKTYPTYLHCVRIAADGQVSETATTELVEAV